MNDAFYVAGIGLGSQERALSVVANNISNLNTQGFKRAEISFAEVMASTSSDMRGVGVRMDQAAAVFDQGDIVETGNSLDIAIDGNGFLELLGPGGNSYLWRGGRLHVGQEGYLQAENGMMLRDMVNVPIGARDIRVDADGTVSALLVNEDAVSELGQLSLVSVNSSADLIQKSSGLYELRSGVRSYGAVAGEDGAGQFVSGAVERSTVDLNQEMVSMMIIQRAYSSNAQVLQAADRLMSIANSLRQQ
ncbi:flagellar hook-basal body protein [Ponticaulis koreensis]|uniref:flagellar hook-basal body protein n=1 Tax=Ponticaulis koreensis TaxID=1123045 RepID=UPI0003B761E8|nr:flagellar hook basal-body protein [Ponticaulis koreensis]